MKHLCSVALVLLMFCTGVVAQRVMKTQVSVSRTGNDQVGSLFVAALNQELSKSIKYDLMHNDEPLSDSAKLRLKVSDSPKNKRPEFFIELATSDVATNEQKHGRASAISVVIESMGLPDSWPVPYMWYHKVILTNRETIRSIRQTASHRYGCSPVQRAKQLSRWLSRRTMEVREGPFYPGLSVTTFPPLPGNSAFAPPAFSPANSASKLGYA